MNTRQTELLESAMILGEAEHPLESINNRMDLDIASPRNSLLKRVINYSDTTLNELSIEPTQTPNKMREKGEKKGERSGVLDIVEDNSDD